MTATNPSSPFTNSTAAAQPFGPPLIGVLLRIPWEAVQRHMLERLHERGFDDLDAAHLNVFQYPGPQGARPPPRAKPVGVAVRSLHRPRGSPGQRTASFLSSTNTPPRTANHHSDRRS